MISDTLPWPPPHAPEASTKLSTSGVYMLFLDGALIYVGRSRNCRARIDAHRASGRLFDRHLIAPCDPSDAAWMERALITAMEPIGNRALFSERRVMVPVPTPIPVEHPLTLVNKTKARAKARQFGLGGEFDAALKCGEFPFRVKNPANTHASAQMVIEVGRIIEWCERQIANRLEKDPHP